MTQSKIKFDFAENTIKVDEKFYKKAQNYGTEEYKALTKICAEHPTASVMAVRREGNYNRVTIKAMEDFLTKYDADALDELHKLCNETKMTISKTGRPYKKNNMGTIRKWFMSNYSDDYIADMKVKEAKAERDKAVADAINAAKKAENADTPAQNQ